MSGRQMSQSANFPGRQLSLQPNVQERNVLGANCPERQLSGRQMSKAPNVGRQMSGRGLAGAICLPSHYGVLKDAADIPCVLLLDLIDIIKMELFIADGETYNR